MELAAEKRSPPGFKVKGLIQVLCLLVPPRSDAVCVLCTELNEKYHTAVLRKK